MTDPFESSKRKIAWAEERRTELDTKVSEFTRVDPYKQIVEPDPQRSDCSVHKVVMTQELPVVSGNIAADVIQNLRAALDNAGYSIACAAGKTDPRYTAFPFLEVPET